MMTAYERINEELRRSPRSWLVTGAAGFIGSNLLETLLRLNQRVIGFDNFATGRRSNLEDVKRLVTPEQWARHEFIEGDIRNLEDCRRGCEGVDFILHQAALGSVPRSLADPIATNAANVTGFVNMLVAARDAKVKRFVYAASSSTYGDHPGLPKVEDVIGRPLSPYAVTKLVNEFYADVFGRCYGLPSIGLRYFNVFGPRQDPNGAYAAVVPKWIAALMKGETVIVNGDGETSRDFCYVDNAVQANLLAALAEEPAAINQVYNVAVGDRTTLNELYSLTRKLLIDSAPAAAAAKVEHRDFRPGDVRHSQADVSKGRRLLGYEPTHRFAQGLKSTVDWHVAQLRQEKGRPAA